MDKTDRKTMLRMLRLTAIDGQTEPVWASSHHGLVDPVGQGHAIGELARPQQVDLGSL